MLYTISLAIHYSLVYRNLILIQSGLMSPLRSCLNSPGLTLLTLCHCTRVRYQCYSSFSIIIVNIPNTHRIFLCLHVHTYAKDNNIIL